MSRLDELVGAHEKLSERHKRALAWFIDHEGQVIPWPEPLADGTILATKAKGIYKPKGEPYALSVRQTLDGPYPDQPIEYLPDGSWQYRYFQEGLDVDEGVDAFTNRGLLECMKDAVPVAVLIQQSPKPNTRYLVQGLAFVSGWDKGYFTLSGVRAEAFVGDVARVGLHERVSPTRMADLIASAFDPRRIDDERRRVSREVLLRRGQPGFRSVLLDAYGSRCVVTDYDAVDALEAAHIVPYRGPTTNHPSNGLLLRGDLHALFDLGLLSIHENELCVLLAKDLRRTKYAPLQGRPIAPPLPGRQGPSSEALRMHRVWAEL